jgi:hypothetical protein
MIAKTFIWPIEKRSKSFAIMKSTLDGMSFNRQDAFGVKKVIGVRVSSCQRKHQRRSMVA